MFVLAAGSLKELVEQTGVSHPTVRSRLEKVIEALRVEIAKSARVKGSVLDAVGGERMSVDEKARLIKDIHCD